MATMSETSYWINFFTTGGIPAGDAAHYAIMFCDNRITREMLMDLSKEYLTDMGITRLGDIIAILKHAKQVFNQEAKDRILKSTNLTSQSSSISYFNTPSPRRSTAASRMVNQITSRHPEASPMVLPPVPKLPPPEPVRASKRKVSVFERLGSEEDTVSLSSDATAATQSSVFSRLGDRFSVKGATASPMREEQGLSSEKVASLPYAGVLKNASPSPVKRARVSGTQLQTKALLRIKKTIRVSSSDEDKKLHIQRPEVSTTTEGVLSDFAKKEPTSLKERLGSKSDFGSITSSQTSSPPQFVSRSKSRILDRLGAKTEESPLVSSTEQEVSRLRKESASKTSTSKKQKGVFSRLGQKPAQ